MRRQKEDVQEKGGKKGKVKEKEIFEEAPWPRQQPQGVLPFKKREINE